MSDVAAGSNAALQLQKNMAAAPDVQQMQTNAMQEQANTLQQQEQNIEKTKFANIVAELILNYILAGNTISQAIVKIDNTYDINNPDNG